MSQTSRISGPGALTIYSIGYCAINKPRGTKTIEVVIFEDYPFLDGNITDDTQDITVSGTDSTGKKYTVTSKMGITAPAVWLPLGRNNITTAPDVRRGERVLIWKLGDSDGYFWISFEDNLLRRRKETIILALTATADESAVPVNEIGVPNPDLCYFMLFSSHDKLLHIHTSQADGEPVGYDIALDTKDGIFTLADTIGQVIRMSSLDHHIYITNASGTSYDADKENLTIEVPDTFKINSKKFIVNSTQLIQTSTATMSHSNQTYTNRSANTASIIAPICSIQASGGLIIAGSTTADNISAKETTVTSLKANNINALTVTANVVTGKDSVIWGESPLVS